MIKQAFLLIFLLAAVTGTAQELRCEVSINAEQTGQANLPVFRTLQRSLTEFINQTNWTDKKFENHERINCSVFINITDFENERFTGSIQVQSSRPVFGSGMTTAVFNFKDEQLTFNYTEFEPLVYNQNSYSSNLVSVISFYVYTILGLDADTFAPEGGTPYFEEANRIVTTAQQGNARGWSAADGTGTRHRLNTELLSNAFLEYRASLYEYHRTGLDVMHKDVASGKNKIATSLKNLEKMNNSRPNSLLMRVFFDAKATEVEQIFSGGPSVPVSGLSAALNRMAPTYSENWRRIQ